jgi:hypothetical protein
MRSILAATAVLGLIVGNPLATSAEEFATLAAGHRAIFVAHCLKCHAADTAEAGVRLDDLPFEIATVAAAERWQKVLGVLNSGEMPPEDEPAIDTVAKTEFLAELSSALAAARKTIGDQGRIATLRRLNRREYQNTLRDLLAADVDVSTLPDDKGAGSFDTLGSSLFMSSDQFEQYLAMGRKAVTAAIEQWRLSSAPPNPATMRTEVEMAARRHMCWFLNDVYVSTYRRAKAWQAASFTQAGASKSGSPTSRCTI